MSTCIKFGLAQSYHFAWRDMYRCTCCKLLCVECREEIETEDDDLKYTDLNKQLWSCSTSNHLDALNKLTNGINIGDLMLEAYQAIGDLDGIYGCGSEQLANTASR